MGALAEVWVEMSRVLSYVCSDDDVLKYFDNLPPGTSVSEVMRAAIRELVRGERAPPEKPLDAAKLEGAKLDNQLKQKKLGAFDAIHELKVDNLRADLRLKASQERMSEAAIAKLTAARGGGYRYILHWKNGDIKFICPHCALTVAEPNSYNPDSYVEAKQKLINHMADKHGIMAFSFDQYTKFYFRDFELRFFGQEIPACPMLTDYAEGKFDYKQYEWPGPAGPVGKALPDAR